MKRTTIGIAALAFAATLASAPAFAQHLGKGLDDGGMVDEPAAPAKTKVLYNSTTPSSVTPTAKHYGKGLDDGGMVDQPSPQQLAAAKAYKVTPIKAPPHYGKGLDDGGTL
jgi:hypothetical protein